MLGKSNPFPIDGRSLGSLGSLDGSSFLDLLGLSLSLESIRYGSLNGLGLISEGPPLLAIAIDEGVLTGLHLSTLAVINILGSSHLYLLGYVDIICSGKGKSR